MGKPLVQRQALIQVLIHQPFAVGQGCVLSIAQLGDKALVQR